MFTNFLKSCIAEPKGKPLMKSKQPLNKLNKKPICMTFFNFSMTIFCKNYGSDLRQKFLNYGFNGSL